VRPRIAAILLALPLVLGAVARADVHGVSIPRRAKRLGDSHFRSPLGFRKTVRYYQRLLKRRASPHTEVPVYRYRGVTVARFVSKAAGGSWRAIHVFLANGITQVYVVPRAASPPPKTLDQP